MKVQKNQKPNLDYRKIAIAVIALILVIVLIIFISKLFSKNNELEFTGFEKAAIYGYLENNLLDVSEIYQKSGKSEYNEIQIFQSKLKQALDSYFRNTTEKTVSTSTILGMIDSKYVPGHVDFHGILVSDYEYQPTTDSFVQSIGAHANLAGMEANINSIDYSDKKASVQKIEKTDDNKYKVYLNIVHDIANNDVAEATGEAIISLTDGKLVLESCTLND